MNELSKEITSQILIDLLYKALSIGYININIDIRNKEESINKILCNIYFYTLDIFMDKLISSFNMEKRITGNIQEEFILNKLYYIRYLDKFIIGVKGSKIDTKIILEKVRELLEENLKLSVKEMKIINSSTGIGKFLETNIKLRPIASKLIFKNIYNKNQVYLLAPTKDIIKNLIEKGYVSKPSFNNSVAPKRIGKLIYLTPEKIIEHYLLLGNELINYYILVNNYVRFRANILYILKYSCALTLCSKFRLGSLHKTFTKFGYNLEIKNHKGEVIKSFS